MRPNDVPEVHHIREELEALEARILAKLVPRDPLVQEAVDADLPPTVVVSDTASQ